MKHLLLISVFLPTLLHTQSLSSCITVLSTAGNDTTIGNKSYTYTIGETTIATLQGDQHTLTHGFNQPECGIIVYTSDQHHAQGKGLWIYPNPTARVLTIQRVEGGNMQLSIHDENGQLLLQEDTTEPEYQLNCEALPSGAYFLQVKSPESGNLLSIPFIKI